MAHSIVEALGPWTARSGPLHRRLAEALRDAIERGVLPDRTRLPAERALARVLAVSRSTVGAAYAALAREGLVEGRRGSGTYVRGRRAVGVAAPVAATRIPRALAIGDHDGLGSQPIELTAAHVPTAPDEVVAEAVVADAVRDPAIRAGHGYVPLGIPTLRLAVAERLTAVGLETSPEQILVTSGAQQALVLSASLLAARGDRVAVESATFPGVLDAVASTGARLVTVPLDGDGVRVGDMRAVVEEHGVRAAFLTASFNNPTGTVLLEARRRELATLAGERDLPVVDDTTTADLWLERPPPPPVAAFAPDAPVLTVGSASKLIWGGLRVGWVRAAEGVVEQLVRLKVVADLGTSVVSQAIVARLLPRSDELGELRRHQIAAGLHVLEGALRAELPEWTWERPRGGLSLWARLPFGDADELAQVALRHGVLILPGTAASATGDHRDRVRLPLLRPPGVLAEGIRRLGAAWRAYEPAAGRRERAGLTVVV